MLDYQFDLDGYVFGTGMPVMVAKEGFDPGDPETITQDGTSSATGARVFGRDVVGAPTWTFALHVIRSDDVAALAELAALGQVWRDPKWRAQDGIARLRYRLAGRDRCVFGRPRRFSHQPNHLLRQGYLPPVATFDCSDSLHYDDTEQYIDLLTAPPIPGGFTVPFEAPLPIEVPAGYTRPGTVTVGGDTATAPVVEFHGPVVDPTVVVGAFAAGLKGSLGVGAVVTVDPRPWAMSVTRSGPGSVQLSRDTRLARAAMQPGTYSAVFTGSDGTGTARVRVRWRNAYTTL